MSDRKKDAAERRDERNIAGDLDEKSSGQTRHKDKKRWCKGKVGVEHTPVCMPYRKHHGLAVLDGAMKNWRELVCSRCGKVLDYYYPFNRSRGKKKPDWVTS